MSVLSYKDIQNFAKTINTTNLPKKNAYSVTGTVTELQSADAYKGDDEHTETLKLAKVQIDGGAECRASYDSVEVQVGDRVVVSIDDGKATITENYTNPNGNMLLVKEDFLPSDIIDLEHYMTLSQVGSNNVYTGSVGKELTIPDGYVIVGIKSIELYMSYKMYANVWSDYTAVTTDGSDKSAGSFIYLNTWSFDGNSILIKFGSTHDLAANEFHFKVRVVYSVMNSKELSTDTSNEENS